VLRPCPLHWQRLGRSICAWDLFSIRSRAFGTNDDGCCSHAHVPLFTNCSDFKHHIHQCIFIVASVVILYEGSWYARTQREPQQLLCCRRCSSAPALLLLLLLNVMRHVEDAHRRLLTHCALGRLCIVPARRMRGGRGRWASWSTSGEASEEGSSLLKAGSWR